MSRTYVLISLLILLPGLAGASVIRVPVDQSSIQLAYLFASPGDTILVADGIYSGPLDRDMEFVGKAISLISENGPERTVLDFQASASDTHQGLVISNVQDSKVLIEGFTLRNAYTYSNIHNYTGGALYFEGDSLEVIDCIFEGNQAREGAAAWILAGWVQIIDCRFTANGYGEWNWDDEEILFVAAEEAMLSGCSFDLNLERALTVEATELTVTQCEFNGNSKGVARISTTYAHLDSCLFANNESDSAITIKINADSLSMSNCTFDSNISLFETVLDLNGTNGSLEGCTFQNNYGYRTGGVTASSSTSLLIADCDFTSNEGDSAAALLLHDTPAEIVRYSFTSNIGTRGGAIWIDSCYVTGRCPHLPSVESLMPDRIVALVEARVQLSMQRRKFMNQR